MSELLEKLYHFYGGKIEYGEATFDNTEVTEGNAVALRKARGVEWGGRGLFLFGDAGTGKSHIMKIIFNHLIHWKANAIKSGVETQGYPYWIKLSVYIEAMRNDNQKLKAKVLGADWLFIDDLGTSTTTEWAVDQVFQLLDERVESKKQTFITSNFDLTQIGEKYHGRVASRIADLCWMISVTGKDRRILRLLDEQKQKKGQ